MSEELPVKAVSSEELPDKALSSGELVQPQFTFRNQSLRSSKPRSFTSRSKTRSLSTCSLVAHNAIPDPCFTMVRVMAVLEQKDGLREFLSDPVNCPIRVRDVLEVFNTIKSDMDAYCSAHFVDSEWRHVCKDNPCAFDHGDCAHAIWRETDDEFQPLLPNMHLVVNRYLKPWTAPIEVSYAGALFIEDRTDQRDHAPATLRLLRVVAPGFGRKAKWKRKATANPASVFISHNWSELFTDFARTLQNVAAPDDYIWVCAFAINQNVTVGKTLGDDVKDSPFARALKLVDRVVVFMDTSASTINRVWCVLEAHLALQANKPLAIGLPNPSDVAVWQAVEARLATLDVRKSEASVASDKAKIMAFIQGREEFINHEVQKRATMSCYDAAAMHAARLDDVSHLQQIQRPLCTDAALRTTLHYAAEAATADSLAWLLELRANVRMRSVHGETALHHTVMSQTGATIPALIAARAEIDARCTGSGWTPLHKAAHRGSLVAALQLLDHKATVDIRSHLGHTPLHLAAEAGRGELVRCLLDVDADCELHAGNTDVGMLQPLRMWCGTPLHHAARAGQVSAITGLLARRAKIDAAILQGSSKGSTPLHCAAAGGHVEAAEVLIHARADVHRRNTSRVFKGANCVHIAAANGHGDVMRVLVEARADVNGHLTTWLHYGFTPLHGSASWGDTLGEATQVLLQGRANIEAQITRGPLLGGRPLHHAAWGGKIEVARLLLEARADVSAQWRAWICQGLQPLLAAVHHGHLEVAKALLEAQADVNSCCTRGPGQGTTPLHLAANRVNRDFTQLLLESEAEVNARLTGCIFRGCQPLHIACNKGNTVVVRMLLEARAEISAPATMYLQRYSGPSALAAKRGHGEALELLLQASGSVNHKAV